MHNARLIDTNAAAKGLSKRFLTSRLFLGPMATCLRRKTDTAMEENMYSSAFGSKELVDTVQTFKDYIKSPPSSSDSKSDEVPRRKSLKHHLNRHHSKKRWEGVK